MNRPVLGVASVLLVASVSLAGCGGTKDEDKSADPTPSAATTTQASPSATATPSATPAGTGLDTSFASGGVAKLALSPGSKDRLSAVTFSADGAKLYAAGLTSEAGDRSSRSSAPARPASTTRASAPTAWPVSTSRRTSRPSRPPSSNRPVARGPEGRQGRRRRHCRARRGGDR